VRCALHAVRARPPAHAAPWPLPAEDRKLQKIIFVAWAPDTGLPVKAKMMYASAREPFKQQLGSGLAYVIQATALDDLDEDDISEMVKKGR
jgi:hypothetical protein